VFVDADGCMRERALFPSMHRRAGGPQARRAKTCGVIAAVRELSEVDAMPVPSQEESAFLCARGVLSTR